QLILGFVSARDLVPADLGGGVRLDLLGAGARHQPHQREDRNHQQPHEDDGEPVVKPGVGVRIAEESGESHAALPSSAPRARYSTFSRRGFGMYRLPAFARGFPSTRTMSAVKSLSPRISDEPTP